MIRRIFKRERQLILWYTTAGTRHVQLELGAKSVLTTITPPDHTSASQRRTNQNREWLIDRPHTAGWFCANRRGIGQKNGTVCGTVATWTLATSASVIKKSQSATRSPNHGASVCNGLVSSAARFNSGRGYGIVMRSNAWCMYATVRP